MKAAIHVEVIIYSIISIIWRWHYRMVSTGGQTPCEHYAARNICTNFS